MRTEAEIKRQIDGILAEKKTVPSHSLFGTPNHAIMDAQVSVLKGETALEDYPEGSWDDSEEGQDETNEIYQAVVNVESWLNHESDDDLFSEPIHV